MIPHTLGGVVALPTLAGPEVLAQVEALGGLSEEFYRYYTKWPSPWQLIRDAARRELTQPGTRYAYEDGRDDYVGPGQGVLVPLAAWLKYREQTLKRWADVIREFGHAWKGPFVYVIDCEDYGAQGVGYSRAKGRDAYVVILEWLWPWGRPRNWHCQFILETKERQLAGEVEPFRGRFYTNAPPKARAGYRLAWIDLAMLGGMPIHGIRPVILNAAGKPADVAGLQLPNVSQARSRCPELETGCGGGSTTGAAPPVESATAIPQLVAAIRRHWSSQGDRATALAIVLTESEGDPSKKSPTGHFLGPWQLKKGYLPDDQAHDIEASTAYARHKLYSKYQWQPWGAFTSGRYKTKLGEAIRLVA